MRSGRTIAVGPSNHVHNADGSYWPGERNPSQRDVEVANESLDAAFLTNFTRELVANSATHQPSEPSLGMPLGDTLSTSEFTYPLSILYSFPTLPPDHIVSALQASCTAQLSADPILSALLTPSLTEGRPVSPYFQLSLACLGCVVSSEQYPPSNKSEMVRTLFMAANALWCVMLEVDNSEARTLEGVLSPVLLSLCGALSADRDLWAPVEQQLLSSAATMARRLRLNEPTYVNSTTNADAPRRTSTASVMTTMLLVDVLSALHMDIRLHLSPNELFFCTDATNVGVYDTYTDLLEVKGQSTPRATSNTDATVVLLLLLADGISIRRSLSRLFKSSLEQTSHPANSNETKAECSGLYVPLSAPSEEERMLEQISNGLAKWYSNFASSEEQSCLDLYAFCCLYISCPDIHLLPQLAAYPPALAAPTTLVSENDISTVSISEESVELAWSVLDSSVRRNSTDRTISPVWSPIIVFMAALVVWADTLRRRGSERHSGHLVQLMAFKAHLEQMPWPCCVQMALTLDRLTRRT